jgi:hypothetical protein
LAIRLFLKNLEAIAFTSTVTFGKYGKPINIVPTHYLKWMLDKQTDYKHNLHLLEFRKLYALRILTRLSHYDPELVPREVLHTAIMSRGSAPTRQRVASIWTPVSGINTIVQVWKAVDNGYNSIQGVYVLKTTHLFTILTSMFACLSTSSRSSLTLQCRMRTISSPPRLWIRNSNVIKQKVDGDPWQSQRQGVWTK